VELKLVGPALQADQKVTSREAVAETTDGGRLSPSKALHTDQPKKDRMPPRGRRKKTQEPEPEPEPEVRDDQDDDAHDGGPPPANDTSASAAAGADGDPPPQSSDDGGASPAARPSRAPAPSAASAGGRGEDGVFKILICTDNHLGYAERDQIRGGDSFAAFEECFQLARHHGADFVLNSGDIFHENKPSRLTLHRVSYLFSTRAQSCPGFSGGLGVYRFTFPFKPSH